MNLLATLKGLCAQRGVRLIPRQPTPPKVLNDTLATAAGLPVWEAVHELLDEAATTQLSDSMNGGLSREQRIAAADGAAALVAFKADLLARVAEAKRPARTE